jgi:hypothetical protein
MTAKKHYAEHLAPIYVWMAGGLESAFSRGASEIEALGIDSINHTFAVDLGAGFGMHTIPLARKGVSVLAIDSSDYLLETLQNQSGKLPVSIAADDLLAFQKHVLTKPDLILCMGDTLTHLPDHASVQRLIELAKDFLTTRGKLILTFRDYSVPLLENNRFIPVRSDENRILTCFLEYFGDYVQVHDLLHERTDGQWNFQMSSYRKLRITPQKLETALSSLGFEVSTEPGLSGMIRIIATVP